MAQPIVNPDIVNWLLSQTALGHSRDALLASMLASGWERESALLTQAAVLGSAGASAMVPEAPLAPLSPVPDPDLSGRSSKLPALDREVEVLAHLRDPRIVVFGGLLSAEECEELCELARPRLERSLTVETESGANKLHEARTSDGMFFKPFETDLIARIERRAAALLRWPVENGEGLQVLRYRPGAEYRPHYDYFDPAAGGTASILKRGGQRVGTLIMYLRSPARGGGTVFPDVGFEAAPRAGNAVFFSYPLAHPSSRSLHGGEPVLQGEKWIATKWMRQRAFA